MGEMTLYTWQLTLMLVGAGVTGATLTLVMLCAFHLARQADDNLSALKGAPQ